jgi:hypothetical protein
LAECGGDRARPGVVPVLPVSVHGCSSVVVISQASEVSMRIALAYLLRSLGNLLLP